MPLPTRFARLNKSFMNRAMRLLAGRVPGFAVVHHTGRKSGARYTSPVWALRRGDTLTIALVYGRGSDWVKNVLAADGCDAEFGRRRTILGQPLIVHDPTHKQAPVVARPLLRLMNVDDGLQLAILSS